MAADVLSREPWQQLLALVLAATVVMGSPGPATISVRRSVRPSACAIRCYTSGIILGTVAVLLVVATGITAILTSMPGCAGAGGASAAYILYLAYKIATAPPLAARDSGEAPANLPRWLPARRRQSKSLCGDRGRVCRVLDCSWRRRARRPRQAGGPHPDDRRHPRPVAAGRRGVRAHPAPAAGVADHRSGLRGNAGLTTALAAWP